jgi:N-acetylmuramoyl-L-alanine amidase
MRPIVFLLLLAFLLACAVPQSAWANPSAEYAAAWQDFHALVKDSQKSENRNSWMALKDRFWKAYNRNTKGEQAPKSLFYLGRVHEEMGIRFKQRSDFLTSIDYYQRVVAHFPNHSWSDDALLRAATIQRDHLGDPAQAYIALLRIVHNYPKGDMHGKAQDFLREMDQATQRKPSPAAKPSTPETGKPSTPSTAQSAAASGNSTHKTPQQQPALQSPARAATLEQIRHWSSDDYTRVVLDLDQEVTYAHKLLKPDPALGTPHRLLLDIQDTRLTDKTAKEYAIADGILRQVRSGQFQHDQARIVLDIQKLENFRVFTLDNPFRIVIDIYAGQNGSASSQAVPVPPIAALDPKPDTRPGAKQEEKPRPTRNTAPMAIPDPRTGSLVEQLGLTVQTIMLDAGHGGKDPGAVSNGIYEKDINLRMVTIMGRMLEEKGFKVLYTRTTDKFIPLDERTAMANTQKVDLFISLHCNAHPNRNVEGFELYYLNLAKSEDAVRVAARENAVSVKKISDLQVILTDLMLNSKIKESSQLARDVHGRATSTMRKSYPEFTDHGVREAPFYVLMGAKMPAILVELGYITNPRNAALLSSDQFLTSMARGLVDGIAEYKQYIERFASVS